VAPRAISGTGQCPHSYVLNSNFSRPASNSGNRGRYPISPLTLPASLLAWADARMARVVVPGIPHHLNQRGNRREDVFFSDDDRQRYPQLVIEYSAKHGIATLAYCLMTNHVHFVSVPARADSLARVLKPVDLRYAQHINRSQGISGRLWQGRFFSCPVPVGRPKKVGQ